MEHGMQKRKILSLTTLGKKTKKKNSRDKEGRKSNNEVRKLQKMKNKYRVNAGINCGFENVHDQFPKECDIGIRSNLNRREQFCNEQ